MFKQMSNKNVIKHNTNSLKLTNIRFKKGDIFIKAIILIPAQYTTFESM